MESLAWQYLGTTSHPKILLDIIFHDLKEQAVQSHMFTMKLLLKLVGSEDFLCCS